MDVIRIFNGLGNQMSQYAFYYAKKKKYPFRTTYITNRTESENIHNGYELERIFGIPENMLRNKILYHILDSHYKHVWGYRLLWHLSHIIEESPTYDYCSELLHHSNKIGFTYYWGGWHSPKYFQAFRTDLMKIFHFDQEKLNKDSKNWLEIISSDIKSCSLHIRRGDFLLDKKWADAIEPDYYDKAIDFINSRGFTHYYVFSNDIKWCRDKFGDKGFFYVDCNSEMDSWQDMFLMSRCRNHINANSTFSWWAAWLCPYKESITIVPKKFRADVNVKDVYPKEWIKL